MTYRDGLFNRSPTRGRDAVGSSARIESNNVTKLGSYEVQRDQVVGRYSFGDEAFGDELLEARPTLWLAVVVGTHAAWQEPEPIGERS